MKLLKGILLVVGGLVVFMLALVFLSVAMSGDSNGDEAKVYEDAPKAPVGPPIDVTAKQLTKEMKANEIATIDKYTDKRLQVSGIVDSIDEDFMGNPVVYLRGSSQWERVGLNGISRDIAAALSKGTGIGVSCTGISEIAGSVFLECE